MADRPQAYQPISAFVCSMIRGQSPDSTPRAASAKRFCGLLDICIKPDLDNEQPLSPPTPGGTTSKLVSSKHVSRDDICDGQQEQQQQQHSQWPCSPAALSRKLASCRKRKCLALQLLAALAVVLLFLWPWILPGLVWRKDNTNWVVPGPEVDPITYEVLPIFAPLHAHCALFCLHAFCRECCMQLPPAARDSMSSACLLSVIASLSFQLRQQEVWGGPQTGCRGSLCPHQTAAFTS